MKRALKWLGISLGAVVLILAVAVTAFYVSSEKRLNRIYAVPEERVDIPADPDSLAYGKHIFQFRGCEACHGENLEGKVYLSDPAIGDVVTTNLTRGQGGVGAKYTDTDWVRTIRHGVRPDGTPLLFMPSTEFYFLSDEDLGAVIAYVKSMPPVDNTPPASKLSITGRIAMALVDFVTFIPAELIPHDGSRPPIPRVGISVEYGEYLAHSCKVCHGLSMSGGTIPGFPDEYPSAANLTPSPERYLPYWEEAGFYQILKTGVARHGRQIDPVYMPWTSYRHMSDDEMKAVWAYLQSLPPVPYGNR